MIYYVNESIGIPMSYVRVNPHDVNVLNHVYSKTVHVVESSV